MYRRCSGDNGGSECSWGCILWLQGVGGSAEKDRRFQDVLHI